MVDCTVFCRKVYSVFCVLWESHLMCKYAFKKKCLRVLKVSEECLNGSVVVHMLQEMCAIFDLYVFVWMLAMSFLCGFYQCE